MCWKKESLLRVTLINILKHHLTASLRGEESWSWGIIRSPLVWTWPHSSSCSALWCCLNRSRPRSRSLSRRSFRLTSCSTGPQVRYRFHPSHWNTRNWPQTWKHSGKTTEKGQNRVTFYIKGPCKKLSDFCRSVNILVTFNIFTIFYLFSWSDQLWTNYPAFYN